MFLSECHPSQTGGQGAGCTPWICCLARAGCYGMMEAAVGVWQFGPLGNTPGNNPVELSSVAVYMYVNA